MLFISLFSCNKNQNSKENRIGHHNFTHLKKIERQFIEKNKQDPIEGYAFIDSLIIENKKKPMVGYHLYLNILKVKMTKSISDKGKLIRALEIIENTEYEEAHEYIRFSIRFFIANQLAKIKNYETAIEQLFIASSILEDNMDKYSYEIGTCYRRVAVIASGNLGEIQKSIISYDRSYEIFSKYNHHKAAQVALQNKAVVLEQNKRYKESKAIVHRALKEYDRDISYKYSAFNTILIGCYQNLGELDSLEFLLDSARILFKEKKITANSFHDFNLDAVAYLIESKQYIRAYSILDQAENSIDHICKYRYNLTRIYRDRARIENKKGNYLKEKKYLVKELKYASECNYLRITNFFTKSTKNAISRLIEINKENPNPVELNKWLMKKIEIDSTIQNQNKVFVKQLNFWANKDLKYAKKEIIYQKDKLKTSKMQNIGLFIFVVILSGMLWQIWSLFKQVKLKRKKLKKINKNLYEKNEELENSYKTQKHQKTKLQLQNEELVLANETIQKKNFEIEGELKNQLLFASNVNKKVKKILKEVDNKISDRTIRVGLRKIIDFDHGDKQIFENIDHSFLKLNEGFFIALSINTPQLTQNDLKLCALIKMNLSTKEIAAIQFTTIGSMKVAKSRLRKKLNIKDSKCTLVSFLNSVHSYGTIPMP